MKKGNLILLIVAILVIVVVAMNWKKWFGKGGKGNGTNAINAQAIADRLYELMKGLTLYPSSREEVKDTLQQVVNSNDAVFISVWNAFGNHDGNLGEWAKDEYYVPSTISETIKNRATQLSLS